MIKGAQRSIIVLKTPTGKYFEQAYFIVKDGFEGKKNSRKDMVKEAYRIASEAITAGGEEDVKKPSKNGLLGLFLLCSWDVCMLAYMRCARPLDALNLHTGHKYRAYF